MSIKPLAATLSAMARGAFNAAAVAGGADIVVVGSANLDFVVEVGAIPATGETVLGGDLRCIPGGKGANQAVAAARLGRRTLMIGRVGDDAAGSTLRAALGAAGVDTAGLLITEETPSGVALIAVDSNGDNAIVVSPGANGRLSAADVERQTDALASAVLVLLQLEVPLDAVVAAMSCARGTVVLNPAPAPARSLPEVVLERVDVLVPNQTELVKLACNAGLDIDSVTAAADTEAVAELARRLGARAVVVTLGADGALVVTPAEVVHVPAPTVDAVDATAAGDAFCAALADALVGGADLIAATRWAVRVGAATTLRPGAQPSLPTAAQVDGLLGG